MNQKKKRVLMTVFGVLLSGVGAGLFDFTSFGMDPFQVLAHGTWYVCDAHVLHMGFGTFYVVINALLLIFSLILDRKKIGLGTLINLFFQGYVVQFSSWAAFQLFPEPSMPVRIVALLLGVFIICLASSFYFTGDMGVSTYDAVALIISQRTKWKFRLVRIATDLVCVAIGFACGAIVGVGTLVTAFFMGPFIDFFNRKVAEPFLYGPEGKPAQ